MPHRKTLFIVALLFIFASCKNQTSEAPADRNPDKPSDVRSSKSRTAKISSHTSTLAGSQDVAEVRSLSFAIPLDQLESSTTSLAMAQSDSAQSLIRWSWNVAISYTHPPGTKSIDQRGTETVEDGSLHIKLVAIPSGKAELKLTIRSEQGQAFAAQKQVDLTPGDMSIDLPLEPLDSNTRTNNSTNQADNSKSVFPTTRGNWMGVGNVEAEGWRISYGDLPEN